MSRKKELSVQIDLLLQAEYTQEHVSMTAQQTAMFCQVFHSVFLNLCIPQSYRYTKPKTFIYRKVS